MPRTGATLPCDEGCGPCAWFSLRLPYLSGPPRWRSCQEREAVLCVAVACSTWSFPVLVTPPQADRPGAHTAWRNTPGGRAVPHAFRARQCIPARVPEWRARIARSTGDGR